MAFIMLSLAPQIISVIGGADYVRSVVILQILGFYMATFFIIIGINYFVVAIGKQKLLLNSYIYIFLINMVLGVVSVYLFSYIGAAVSSLLINVVLLYFGLNLLKREKFSFHQSILIKSFLSGMIMSAALYLIVSWELIRNFSHHGLIAQVFIASSLFVLGLGIYLVSLFKMGAISKEDIKLIREQKIESTEDYNLG